MSTETRCSYCGESMYSDLQFTMVDAWQRPVAQTHIYCSSMWLDECQDPDLKNGYPVSELTQLPNPNTAVYLVNAPKPGKGSPTVIACCAEHKAEALKWGKSKRFGRTSKVYTYDQALASLQDRAKELRAQFFPVGMSGPAGGGSATRQAATGNYFDQYGRAGQAMQDDPDGQDDAAAFADNTIVALEALTFTSAATPDPGDDGQYDGDDFDRDVIEPPKRSRRVQEMVGMSDGPLPSTPRSTSSKSKSLNPLRVAQAVAGFRRKRRTPSSPASPRTGDNKAEQVLGERSLPLSTSVANLALGAATSLTGDHYHSEEGATDNNAETGTETRSFV